MRLLAFIFGDSVYKFNSWLVANVLRLRGVAVGKRFYCQGIPKLKLKGDASNIILGDDVSFLGDVDLRNRENGRIIIENGASIDEGCRLVAANNATLRIGELCRIGLFTVFNCGDDISIGRQSLISGFCYIQSSNHGMSVDTPIQNQPHTYGKISIGPDVWLGSHVTILPGVIINKGAIIGAKSVVTKDVSAYKIHAGVPSKEIRDRS